MGCVMASSGGALSDDDLVGHMARVAVHFREGARDATWAQIYDSPRSKAWTP
jgi:hypothetical protein